MGRTREDFFAVLVREHESGLRAFVRACVHDRAEADDIVQDTFVASWRQLDEYDRDRPFSGWLRGIAQHKILAYFRTCQAHRRHVRMLPPEAVASIADEFTRLNRPARGEVYRDCFAALRECLGALSAHDRDIVERVYRQDQACSTIAGELGHTVEAVKKRLQRARAELRDCIMGKLEGGLVDA